MLRSISCNVLRKTPRAETCGVLGLGTARAENSSGILAQKSKEVFVVCRHYCVFLAAFHANFLGAFAASFESLACSTHQAKNGRRLLTQYRMNVVCTRFFIYIFIHVVKVCRRRVVPGTRRSADQPGHRAERRLAVAGH